MDWYELTNKRIEIEVGLRIKQHRIKKNLTQLELATKAGLSRVAISKIERGNGVNLSSLIEILRNLDLLQNIAYVFPEEEISPIELVKLKGKMRKRVSSKKSK